LYSAARSTTAKRGCPQQ